MASRSIISSLLRRGNFLGRRRLQVLSSGPGLDESVLMFGNNGNWRRLNVVSFGYCSPSMLGVRNFQGGRTDCSNKAYITCASCSHSYSKDMEDFVNLVRCPKCDTLQKLEGAELPNYFQILKQAKSYRVDATKVANEMKKLQKVFHPDLYGGKGEGQQNLSQEYSSLLNKALTTLTSPVERGRYLLLLGGVDIEDPSSDLEKVTTSDQSFLREVMSLNEDLEEIGDPHTWKEFNYKNHIKLEILHEKLADAFELNNLDEALQLLGKMKYYDSLQNRIRELQSRMSIVE